jgi:RHS repeat-associated protein
MRKFIYGPGIDEPICMVDVADSNAVYYYHFDGLGSVVALSDVNNVIVESYSYDVFGAPTIYDANYIEISKSAVGNPYMFTARRADDETALYYYRARYYAFDIGRFLQTDPVGYYNGLNMYTYCGNNPIGLVDPLGLCKEQPFSWWDNLKIILGSAIGDAIGQWYEASGGEEMEEYYWEGGHVGTQYGESALDRYAYEIAFGNASWYNYAGAFLSSLWLPESWKTTTITLGTAANSAAQARVANATTNAASEGSVTVDANKLHHIFDNVGHGLEGVVGQYGSQEAAYQAIQQATEAAVNSQGLTGIFTTTVQVGGKAITVAGNVVSGVVKIGTAFIK